MKGIRDMEKIETIKDLYFNQKKNLTEISEILGTSISYISKILRNDKRYEIEKNKRRQEKLSLRRKKQKKLIYEDRKNRNDIDYINMKNQHEQDTRELSKHSVIGNDILRKWCSSAYKYNKKRNRYEFISKDLIKPADFPEYIKA